jgi:hypothetical protein
MTISDDNAMMPGQDVRTAELREMIQRAFPAETYDGVITGYDDKLDDPELDEEKELYENLKGKEWTDVPQQLIRNKPDGCVRLTNESFPAFIAAWLMHSLENMNGENGIPKHDMVPDTTEFIRQRLIALKQEQRYVLHALLTEFAKKDPSAFQRGLALEAVALLESLV